MSGPFFMMRIKHTPTASEPRAITNEVGGRDGVAHRRPAARGVPAVGGNVAASARGARGPSAARCGKEQA